MKPHKRVAISEIMESKKSDTHCKAVYSESEPYLSDKSLQKPTNAASPFNFEISLYQDRRDSLGWNSPYKIEFGLHKSSRKNSLDLKLFHNTNRPQSITHLNRKEEKPDIRMKVSSKYDEGKTKVEFDIFTGRNRFRSFKIQRGRIPHEEVVSDSEISYENEIDREDHSIGLPCSPSVTANIDSDIGSESALKETSIKERTMDINKSGDDSLIQDFLEQIHVQLSLGMLSGKRSSECFETEDFERNFYAQSMKTFNQFIRDNLDDFQSAQAPTLHFQSQFDFDRFFQNICLENEILFNSNFRVSNLVPFVFKWKNLVRGLQFFDSGVDLETCVECGQKLSPRALGGHMSQRHPRKSKKYRHRIQRRNWRKTERKAQKGFKRI